MIRLNLGAGDVPLEGYEPRDAAKGDVIYPLPDADGSVDEIRASHVLEHFPRGHTEAVLREWVRALKTGGELKVSVPDFEVLAEQYLKGANLDIEGMVMGGQINRLDYHHALFDFEQLSESMRKAGLVAINGWKSTIDDCAAMPISLNLRGWKRPAKWPKVSALMSVPRLGFMDNFFCATDALPPLGISLRKYTGAFWGQCLERGFELEIGDEQPEFLLTIDYDTVFSRQDIEDLLMLMLLHPEADAIAPVQAARSKNYPLFVIRGPDGKGLPGISAEYFEPPLAKVATAHFGCTLIRTSSLLDMPKPWFHSKPDPQGGWNEGREDDDIWFWNRWAEAGKSLYAASRVSVGHLELMIRWPDGQFRAIHQHPAEYWQSGRPAEVWR